MKRIFTFAILFMVTATTFAQIKILPLGESTTDFGPSYRRKLCELMTNFGSKYDMVGPKNDGSTIYDGDHAGYSGNPSSQVQANLIAFAPNIIADVVLIWEGTNDCGWASTNGDTTELGKLVDKTIQLYPNAQIFVGTIPPMSFNAYESQEHGRKPGIAQANGVTFNKNLPLLVSRRAAIGKKIYLVDATSMTLADVSSDGIHPNQQGYDKMGTFFFEALKKTVLDTQKPTAPTNLMATNITNNILSLSWVESTDNMTMAGYDIYRNGVYYASTNGSIYEVNNLGSGIAYKIKVQAKDASGNLSDFSSEITVTMKGNIDKIIPTTPANLSTLTIAATNFVINWSAATDNDLLLGYEIFKDGQFLSFVPATETKLAITNLTPAVSYTMTVRAKDASDNVSSKSNPLIVKTLDGILKYEAEEAALTGGAKKATNHSGFSGTGFVDFYEVEGVTTTFNVGVAEAGNYLVSLRYCNSMGNDRTLSIYVNGVKAKQSTMPSLANWDTWADKSETLTLTAGANKIAYVFDKNDIGFVNIDYIEIAKSTVTLIESTQILDLITYYPNPVANDGIVNIDLSKLDNPITNISLHNSLGKLLMNIPINNLNKLMIQVPLNLRSGVYILEVNSLNNKFLKKIIVQ